MVDANNKICWLIRI